MSYVHLMDFVICLIADIVHADKRDQIVILKLLKCVFEIHHTNAYNLHQCIIWIRKIMLSLLTYTTYIYWHTNELIIHCIYRQEAGGQGPSQQFASLI